jgi:hypothetical protein
VAFHEVSVERVSLSALEKEFHLDAADFDDVVILQWMGLGIQCLAIDDGKVGTFDMGNEIAMRPSGDDRNLHPWFA